MSRAVGGLNPSQSDVTSFLDEALREKKNATAILPSLKSSFIIVKSFVLFCFSHTGEKKKEKRIKRVKRKGGGTTTVK